MKTKKVYKAVRQVAPNKFASALVSHDPYLCRYYKIGKTVMPYPGTKLFAFTNLKQAIAYAQNSFDFNLHIYEARAENPVSNGWLEFSYSVDEVVKAFAYKFATNVWAKQNIMVRPAIQNSSCVVCDSIRLTKRVWSPK